MGIVSQKQHFCELGMCGKPYDWVIYANDLRPNDFLAIYLCEKHYEEIMEQRPPRETPYKFASKYITQSLG